jgi:hypothetical protein
MNSAVWAGVAAEEAARVKVGDQAEVTAGVRAKAGVGSLNKSTILPINDTEGR